MENKKFICCICTKPTTGFGNNPEGAAVLDQFNNVKFLEFKDGDRCCDECNNHFVIPGRLYKIYRKK